MRITSISAPKALVELLDLYCEERGYNSRAEGADSLNWEEAQPVWCPSEEMMQINISWEAAQRAARICRKRHCQRSHLLAGALGWKG